MKIDETQTVNGKNTRLYNKGTELEQFSVVNNKIEKKIHYTLIKIFAVYK